MNEKRSLDGDDPEFLEDPKVYLVQQESIAGGPMITWSAWLTQQEAEYALKCQDNGRPGRVFEVVAMGSLAEAIDEVPDWVVADVVRKVPK